jgi:hypothetical protein
LATATPQSKAALVAANQAAIDSAKLIQARDKAAKTATPSTKPTLIPTATPPPPPQPAPPKAQPTPTGLIAKSQSPPASVDLLETHVDESSLENVPIDQASTLTDAAAG